MATKTKTKTRAKSSNGKPKTAAAAKNRIANVGTDAEIVEIQEFKIGSLRVRLNGASALFTHNCGAESRHAMLGKQTGTDTDTDRELRCPVEEFMEAAYPVHGPQKPKPKIKDGRKIYAEKAVHNWFAKTTFGIPIVAFKNALVSTGRTSSEFNMAGLRSTFFVKAVNPKHPDYAIIDSPTPPEMDSRIVRIGRNIPMERFRPKWNQWSTEIIVEYDYAIINADQVANLLAKAGHYVGVMEGRPEKCALSWGRWTLDNIAASA